MCPTTMTMVAWERSIPEQAGNEAHDGETKEMAGKGEESSLKVDLESMED